MISKRKMISVDDNDDLFPLNEILGFNGNEILLPLQYLKCVVKNDKIKVLLVTNPYSFDDKKIEILEILSLKKFIKKYFSETGSEIEIKNTLNRIEGKLDSLLESAFYTRKKLNSFDD